MCENADIKPRMLPCIAPCNKQVPTGMRQAGHGPCSYFIVYFTCDHEVRQGDMDHIRTSPVTVRYDRQDMDHVRTSPVDTTRYDGGTGKRPGTHLVQVVADYGFARNYGRAERQAVVSGSLSNHVRHVIDDGGLPRLHVQAQVSHEASQVICDCAINGHDEVVSGFHEVQDGFSVNRTAPLCPTPQSTPLGAGIALTEARQKKPNE